MGLLETLGLKKKKDPRDNHTFTDEERRVASLNRTTKLELAKKKSELDMTRLELEAERDRIKIQFDIERMQEKLDDLRAENEDYDEPESNTEDVLLTTLLSKILAGQGAQDPTPTGPAPGPAISAPPKVELTDDRIREIIKSQDKKTLKFLRKLPRTEQQKIILTQLPPGLSIEDNTMERALNVLNE